MTATAIQATTSDQTAHRTACRDCSGWKIAADRALGALLDELDAGSCDGRVRLDISTARLDELVGGTVFMTADELTADCAALRGAAALEPGDEYSGPFDFDQGQGVKVAGASGPGVVIGRAELMDGRHQYSVRFIARGGFVTSGWFNAVDLEPVGDGA